MARVSTGSVSCPSCSAPIESFDGTPGVRSTGMRCTRCSWTNLPPTQHIDNFVYLVAATSRTAQIICDAWRQRDDFVASPCLDGSSLRGFYRPIVIFSDDAYQHVFIDRILEACRITQARVFRNPFLIEHVKEEMARAVRWNADWDQSHGRVSIPSPEERARLVPDLPGSAVIRLAEHIQVLQNMVNAGTMTIEEARRRLDLLTETDGTRRVREAVRYARAQASAAAEPPSLPEAKPKPTSIKGKRKISFED